MTRKYTRRQQRGLTVVTVMMCWMALAIGPHVASADGHKEYVTGESRLSVADELAIRQVIARTNHCIDAADYELYLTFFTDDIVMDSGFGAPVVGKEGVLAMLEMSRPLITNKRHVAGNVVINGQGNQAQVVTYLMVFERSASISLVGTSVITDQFVKKDGRWLISRHDTRMDPATKAAVQAMMQSADG